VRRLPLPLARLCRLAEGARTPLERHAHAFYLWEASLRLLGSVALVEYLARDDCRPDADGSLAYLVRPSLRRWWEVILSVLPHLAGCGDAHFASIDAALRAGAQVGLPRTQALVAQIREDASAPAPVGLEQAVDELVAYRARELGHGMAGERPNEFYTRMGT